MNFLTDEQRHLRASDQERDEVIDHLKVCSREGRISLDELSERVQKAVTAKTLGELQDLCIDLPDDPTVSLVKTHDAEIMDFSDTQLSDDELEAWRQDRQLRHKNVKVAMLLSFVAYFMIASMTPGPMLSRAFGSLVIAAVIITIIFLRKLK